MKNNAKNNIFHKSLSKSYEEMKLQKPGFFTKLFSSQKENLKLYLKEKESMFSSIKKL